MPKTDNVKFRVFFKAFVENEQAQYEMRFGIRCNYAPYRYQGQIFPEKNPLRSKQQRILLHFYGYSDNIKLTGYTEGA